MTFLNNLSWRYATKQFSEKKVDETTLTKIKEAIQMSPSSFGLQPYHIIEVTDPEIRSKLQEKSWGQTQITEASNLLVFCADNRVEERINAYLDIKSGGSVEIREKLAGYEQVMKGFAQNLNEAQRVVWATKQSYIALGFALAACAELSVDSCPMEGFDPAAYKEILGLPAHLTVAVVLPIGYRNDADAMAPNSMPKTRFSETDLFSKK